MRIRDKAFEALIELGATAGTKGFTYVLDAMEVIDSNQSDGIPVMQLYEVIASKHKAGPKNVERCIRGVFTKVVSKGDPVLVKQYLSLTNTTNGSLLYMLHYRLSKE